MGVVCDGTHEHTQLVSKWTSWSQAYPRLMCKRYVRLVADGRRGHRAYRSNISALLEVENFTVVFPGRCDGQYPSAPLAYPNEAFKKQIINSIHDTDKRIAPIHGSGPEEEPPVVPEEEEDVPGVPEPER